MTPAALVTGATGLLGREVVRAFERAGWYTVGTGFSRAKPPAILKVDLREAKEIEQALDKTKPQVVVHCAAERFPDRVDANPSAARALNVAATSSLASACNTRGILLIYISTDYVFAGKPGDAPHSASAATGPPNLYGQTKLDGERVVLDATRDTGLGAILRVPVLYGPVGDKGNSESAVNTLLDSLDAAQAQPDGSTKEVMMDDWSLRYPTHTEDVGRVCADIARVYLSKTGTEERVKLPHILQFSADDRMTKYEMCEVFAEIMGLPMGGLVANKKGNDPKAAVQRPYDTHMSTDELKSLGINVVAQDFKAWFRWQARAFRK